MIGALALDGVAAGMSVAAATSTAVFLAFVEQVLIPALRERPDAIVVMDNLVRLVEMGGFLLPDYPPQASAVTTR